MSIKGYTQEEAFEQSNEYFNGNELSTSVFMGKYALRDENDNILEPTPEYMHKRLAKEFARVEKNKYEGTSTVPYTEEEIFKKLDGFRQIIPQGSPMYAIGNPYQKSSASNCFVADCPEDSYGGIMHTDEQLVQLSKRRAGVGIDISKLRPKGMGTRNAARTTTGIVPFCERYSNSIREVGQNGRRGALMITCDIRHPEAVKLYTDKDKGEKVVIEGAVVDGMKQRDIETTSEFYNPNDADFCTMKLDSTKVTGANVSIKLTDEFLDCVKNDKPFIKRWPIDASPENAEYTEEIDAKRAWEKIIHCAWQKEEPGILFWDSMLKESPADCYAEHGFNSVSTNPCVIGDTVIKFKNSPKDDINYGEISKNLGVKYVWNGFEFSKVDVKKTGENQHCFKVFLSSGKTLTSTDYHRWKVWLDGKKTMETKDLEVGMILAYNNDEYVVKIEDAGFHDVYCFTEPKRGTGWFNGIITLQCGEIVLNELDSCRLLVVNLFGCVDNPYTPEAKFDYKKLKEDAYFAQRLMDDLVDLELERIDEIISKIKDDPQPENIKNHELALWEKIRYNCENGRRTGTGIVALGDALAASNIIYGSDESIDACEEIYKTLKLGAYRASVDMAKAIGSFTFWNPESEKENPYLLRIKEEDPFLYDEMSRYGRRNISLLTTAPTGSVAILTQLTDGIFGSTGGIEPNYSNVPYTRKKKINPEDKNSRVDSTDQNGDKWQHFDVYPAGLEAWMKISGKDPEESPYHGGSAEELDWKQRVKFQAVAQKHVDHSISSTVNLPSDVSEEKVSEIYYTSWEYGLKGITVYRDGCRTGVLVKKVQEEENIELHTQKSPKRPKMLDGDIHLATVKGEKYIIAVGLLHGQPYEVFGGKANGFGIKQKCEGKIIKHKKGQYGLELDSIEIDDFSKHFTPQEQTIFRLASTNLRHGIPIEFVIEQMQKSTDDMFSLPSALGRVLKKYIKDGQKATGKICPSCGSEDIIYQEGCNVCKSCGWSACS